MARGKLEGEPRDFKEHEGKSCATQPWVFLHEYFMNSVLG